MSVRPYRLLIVGAGLTAAVTSALIKQCFHGQNIEIHVWEKSRGVGGRMTSHRSSGGSGVDLGAQYITKRGQYAEKHKRYFINDWFLHQFQTDFLNDFYHSPVNCVFESRVRAHAVQLIVFLSPELE